MPLMVRLNTNLLTMLMAYLSGLASKQYKKGSVQLINMREQHPYAVYRYQTWLFSPVSVFQLDITYSI